MIDTLLFIFGGLMVLVGSLSPEAIARLSKPAHGLTPPQLETLLLARYGLLLLTLGSAQIGVALFIQGHTVPAALGLGSAALLAIAHISVWKNPFETVGLVAGAICLMSLL